MNRILVLIVLFLSSICISFSQVVDEYLLKVVYISNFPLFTEWPDNSDLNDLEEPFIITIIGENPFKGNLKSELEKRNKKLKNRVVLVKYVNNINELKKTNILFISSSKKYNISKIINQVRGKPILTIGDTQSYARKGVMINMILYKSKIKFNINIKEAKKSNIYISSKLLANAAMVYK